MRASENEGRGREGLCPGAETSEGRLEERKGVLDQRMKLHVSPRPKCLAAAFFNRRLERIVLRLALSPAEDRENCLWAVPLMRFHSSTCEVGAV